MVRAEQIQEFVRIIHARGMNHAWIEVPAATSATAVSRSRPRSRIIGSHAGHGLEILGHAIEYLVDEYLQAGGAFCEEDPMLQAILLLMAANREIYFSCPLRPTFFERLRQILSQLGL